MESDPIGLGAGVNTYVYADDDPIGLLDPNGLAAACGGLCHCGCLRCHIVYMAVTGYDNGYESTGKNPGDPGYGITSSGKTAGPGTIAAPKTYPYGTGMYVPGYGCGNVQDRGGAIKGAHIDLWFSTKQAAINWGRHLHVPVEVCDAH
jgi:3D (Asp-Asp-Asp) domain-containing protein